MIVGYKESIFHMKFQNGNATIEIDSDGTRTTTFLRNITQGIRYTLSCKTGYDNSSMQLAESTVTISGGGNTRSRTLEHTYTTEGATTRYGAYEACDTCSDDRFQIRIRNVQLCRTN